MDFGQRAERNPPEENVLLVGGAHRTIAEVTGDPCHGPQLFGRDVAADQPDVH